MQLATTFRGLNRAESATAASHLERNMSRLDRLMEQPAQVRARVEGGPPENRVMLTIVVGKEEVHAQSNGHDLVDSINIACNRLRSQILRRRNRRTTGRHKAIPDIAV